MLVYLFALLVCLVGDITYVISQKPAQRSLWLLTLFDSTQLVTSFPHPNQYSPPRIMFLCYFVFFLCVLNTFLEVIWIPPKAELGLAIDHTWETLWAWEVRVFLVEVSVKCLNHHDQKQLGVEKGFSFQLTFYH